MAGQQEDVAWCSVTLRASLPQSQAELVNDGADICLLVLGPRDVTVSEGANNGMLLQFHAEEHVSHLVHPRAAEGTDPEVVAQLREDGGDLRPVVQRNARQAQSRQFRPATVAHSPFFLLLRLRWRCRLRPCGLRHPWRRQGQLLRRWRRLPRCWRRRPRCWRRRSWCWRRQPLCWRRFLRCLLRWLVLQRQRQQRQDRPVILPLLAVSAEQLFGKVGKRSLA
mmetsp:Transcript_102956/g.307549  ORF Transcript_102956/g.307549 Transcript_102956/m.307549 type:complete len:223 (+) Transcript_102956:575-1243(+)